MEQSAKPQEEMAALEAPMQTSRTWHLLIKTDDKIKGMTVACETAIPYEEMLLSATSRFGSDRIISITAK